MKSTIFFPEHHRLSTTYTDCIVLKSIKNNTIIEDTYIDMDAYLKAIEALKIAEEEIHDLRREIRRMKISKLLK